MQAVTTKDINEYSNLSLSWTQRKTGRKVTHLIFTFSEKEPITGTAPKTRKKQEAVEPGKRTTSRKNAAKHIEELKTLLG